MTARQSKLRTKLLADVRRWRATMPPADGEWREIAAVMKSRLGIIEVFLKEGRMIQAMCAMQEMASYMREVGEKMNIQIFGNGGSDENNPN